MVHKWVSTRFGRVWEWNDWSSSAINQESKRETEQRRTKEKSKRKWKEKCNFIYGSSTIQLSNFTISFFIYFGFFGKLSICSESSSVLWCCGNVFKLYWMWFSVSWVVACEHLPLSQYVPSYSKLRHSHNGPESVDIHMPPCWHGSFFSHASVVLPRRPWNKTIYSFPLNLFCIQEALSGAGASLERSTSFAFGKINKRKKERFSSQSIRKTKSKSIPNSVLWMESAFCVFLFNQKNHSFYGSFHRISYIWMHFRAR